MQRALPPMAAAFCAGAALRFLEPVAPVAAYLFLTVSVLGLCAAWRRPRLGAAALIAVCAAFGLLRATTWLIVPSDSVANLTDRRWVRLHGAVSSEPAVGPSGTTFDLDVDRAETRREPMPVSGRVRIYLPPEKPAPSYGQSIAAEGRVSLPADAENPGEVPPAQFLRRDGVAVVMSPRFVRLERGRRGNAVVAMALRSKEAMERGLDATLPPNEDALMKGLLFSDTGGLSDDVRQDFSRAGTVHILSTSGLHVTILAGLLGFLWRPKRTAARKLRSLILLAALIFFALMTGLRPAVMRAVIMCAAVLAAPLFDREPDVPSAIALAALILVAWSPGNLLDPGFQLSFAAIISLCLVRRPPVPTVNRIAVWRRRGEDIVIASVVASVATAPLAALYFGVVSVASPLTNLLVVPAVIPAMALGLVEGVSFRFAPRVACWCGLVNARVLAWMLWVTHAVAAQSWSAVTVAEVSGGAVLAIYAAAVAVAAWKKMASPPWQSRPAMALAVIPAAFFWMLWAPPAPLRITFLNVGQGDCSFIQTPGGHTILIDAGGHPETGTAATVDVGERTVVPALRRAGVRKIDAVILTHPHEDHAGGLPAVLGAFPCRLWLDSGQPHIAPGFNHAEQIARQKGIAIRVVRTGRRLNVEPGVWLDILAPANPLLHQTRDDLNNNSIVARLQYGAVRVLFCGDAEWESEDRMLRAGADLKADVLKVGHHGSGTSSGPAFLEAVHSGIAVISCGRHNVYGHPSEATLERLQSVGARTYRTDIDGGIVVTTDGRNVTAATSRWVIP